MLDSEQTRSLSDLCSICNKQIPKYCCPRDGTRTCSLACIKRHKERALCDGQRVATGFVKKSQLETPAGIDHDFNFLAGLERRIDDAEGRVKDQEPAGGSSKRKHPGVGFNLDRRIYEAGVTVKKAPQALSRHRTNKTFHHRGENAIHWTVEWILDNGAQFISHPISEAKPLDKCYNAVLRQSRKRKLGELASAEKGSNKSQNTGARNEASVSMDVQAARTGVLVTSEHTKRSPQASFDIETPQDRREQGASLSEVGPEQKSLSEQHEMTTENVEPELDNSTSQSRKHQGDDEPDEEGGITDKPEPTTKQDAFGSTATVHMSNPHDSSTSASPSFFLLKPSTPAHQPRVLIPLSPGDTLASALKGRTVLEYPTVVVLAKPSETLPNRYVSEAEYLAGLTRADATVGGMEADRGLDDELERRTGEGEGRQEGEAGDDVVVDEASITQVLRQDLLKQGLHM